MNDTVVIRNADLEKDALALVDGARAFMAWIDIPYLFPDNEDDLISAVWHVISLPESEIFVAEQDGRIIGGIAVLFAPYIWASNKLVGDELFWWVEEGAPFRTARLLFDTALQRIRERGAIPMFHSMSSSPKGVNKLYLKAGLRPIETAFVGEG